MTELVLFLSQMSRTDQSYYFFVGSLGKGKNDFVAESAVIEVIALRTFGSYVTRPRVVPLPLSPSSVTVKKHRLRVVYYVTVNED